MTSTQLDFVKYTGAGNDFLIVDAIDPEAVPFLCDRHFGVGADGVIVPESSDIADVRMRLYNADGGEADMCGNGLRCFAHHLWQQGKHVRTVETQRGVLEVFPSGDLVSTTLPFPKEISTNPLIIDTGVPHLITFVDDIDAATFDTPLRHTYNANLNLVQIISSSRLALRTYERGVEGETLACGTGAAAAALAFGHSADIQVQSGEILKIDLSPLTMAGPAQEVFRGSIAMPTGVC